MDSGDFAGTERFTIAARLGAGGMGIVYKAYDREHGTHVALKTLSRIDARDLLRFKAEFRALSDVRHPNLVSFGELFESTGRWFFTMELVDGVDFRTWVSDASWLPDAPTLVDGSVDGPTPLSLVALHGAGKVHRDIKPSNIMVTPEGRVVILDFGLVTDAIGRRRPPRQRVAGLRSRCALLSVAMRRAGIAAARPSRPPAWRSMPPSPVAASAPCVGARAAATT